MTYRENPKTGEKISLLGYGMMRLPVEGGGASGKDNDSPIDQEQVNRLVDYALEHGVNYFDTSPAYCKGLSERSTGIALSRHKRSEYYVATKLSNFNEETWGREASLEMYRNSMKELQVDYIDYYLLHGIGMGGMDNLHTHSNGFLCPCSIQTVCANSNGFLYFHHLATSASYLIYHIAIIFKKVGRK